MVRVCFRNLSRQGRVVQRDLPESAIILEGHAGFGMDGNDIVCAGVSAVVQTALAGISGVAVLPQKVRQEKGYLETRVSTGGQYQGEIERLEVIVHTLILGLQEIQKAYPGSIELVFGENI